MTNTMLTAAAIDHQADWVYTILRDSLRFERELVGLAASDWEFASALSPAFTGTEHLGYFV
jgi:hypothetical protein